MTGAEQIRMDGSECDELLERATAGVISFSTPDGEPPHALPVSFGYDAVESVFYFRLAEGESEKGPLDGRATTFTVHEHADEGHRSVVAQGALERTTNEEIATETLEGLERVTIPFVDIFGEPPAEVEFTFYRLVPDRLTGRKETTTAL